MAIAFCWLPRVSGQYIHILNCKENKGVRDTVFLFNPYSPGAVSRTQKTLPEGVHFPYNSTIPDSEVVTYDTLLHYAAEKCEALGKEAYARIVLAMIKEPYIYVKQNLRYPEAMQKKNTHGYVSVAFTIKANETAKNVGVVHSLHPLLDAEAIRLVKEIPASQWLIPEPMEYKSMIYWGNYQCRMLLKY